MTDRTLWATPPTTVPDAARVLDVLGWEILPVKPGEKVPATRGWTTETYRPDDFTPDDNLGVRLAPPVVDIDLDVPEASILAEALLPPTLVSGRPSNPRSHFWYGCETAVPYRAYTDDSAAARTMLVELRAGRERYTLVPPSTHPSGETLTWTGETLTAMDAEGLQRLVALVAALTLIARHWPGTGQRHAAAGATTGWLLRHQIPPALIRSGMRALCQAARDEEGEDRLRHVDSTIARWDADQAATGGTTLTELLGDIVTKATGWLRDTWGLAPALKESDPRITTLNATHFVVRLNSQVVVGLEEADSVVFQTFREFEHLHLNAPKVGTRPLAKVWLEHPARRGYSRVGFAPPGAPPLPADAYNLWRGMAVSPYPGPHPEARIPRYLEHLTDVIADGKTEVADFVLDLMADAVQRPGRPIGKALALRGKQGSGKSSFVEAYGKLFGRHFITVSSRDQIVGKFNAHLSGKVVVFADEAIWGGSRDSIGTLKRLVTQNTTTIERKGVDLATEPNYVHLFMATNEDWTWPAGNYERRGVILDVNKDSSEGYFAAFWKELESREFGPALLAYLQARAVDTARLRRGLHTAALEEQQDYTADPIQTWWREILDEGAWTGDGAKIPEGKEWPTFLATASVYDAYSRAVRSARHIDTRAVFLRRWAKFLPRLERTKQRAPVNVARSGAPHYESQPTWGVFVPSLDVCRRAFVAATGITRAWQAPSATLLEEETTL